MQVPSGQTCPNGCIGIIPTETKAVRTRWTSSTGKRGKKFLPEQTRLFDLYDDTGSHQ